MCIFEGKEYGSDTGRIIRKYDIYTCDLGKPVNNNLGKNRPCVIIQSNKINNPKQNRYIVAPIRTEHQMEVSQDTLQTIVSAKRELGRVYIPIEMEPGKFSFIDMTRIESVQSTEVKSYRCSIINPDLKNKINNALRDLLFSDDENEFTATSVEDDVKSSDKISEEIQEAVTSKTQKKSSCQRKKRIRRLLFDDKFVKVYCKWINKEISSRDAAKQLNIEYSTFNKAVHRYETQNNINRDELLKENSTDNHNKIGITESKPQVNSFIDAYEQVITQKLTIDDVAPLFRLDRNGFIKQIEDYENNEISKFNEYKRKHARKCSKMQLPNEFIRTHIQWKAKMINGEQAASQLGLSYNNFIYLNKQYKNYKETCCK